MPPFPLELALLAFAAVLGSLIGSFANVVIYRLPRGESVVFPGSGCPRCGRRLGPLELVPVLSWAAQGGRCRGCSGGISARYPLVELGMAALFVLLLLRWPPLVHGATVVPLLAVGAALLILALIDIDTFTLPDSLTLPAVAVAVAAPLLYSPASGLPDLAGALFGAAIGAGALTLVNRVGGLALRRGRDTAERTWPLGFDQVNLAALAGLAGWPIGVGAAAASLVLNLVARRPLRVPEPLVYAAWAVGLLGAVASGLPPQRLLAGSVAAAGAAAIAGAAFWWLHDLRAARRGPAPRPAGAGPEAAEVPEATAGWDPAPDRDAAAARAEAAASEVAAGEDEPIAMGFGDAKLAAVLGALLGWEKLLLALFLSFLLGAAGGLLGRLFGGDRVIPFGPYLVLAAFVTLFLGDALLGWYLGLLGF